MKMVSLVGGGAPSGSGMSLLQGMKFGLVPVVDWPSVVPSPLASSRFLQVTKVARRVAPKIVITAFFALSSAAIFASSLLSTIH